MLLCLPITLNHEVKKSWPEACPSLNWHLGQNRNLGQITGIWDKFDENGTNLTIWDSEICPSFCYFVPFSSNLSQIPVICPKSRYLSQMPIHRWTAFRSQCIVKIFMCNLAIADNIFIKAFIPIFNCALSIIHHMILMSSWRVVTKYECINNTTLD